MRIGVVYPQTELGGDPEAVRRVGRAAEELGFDHLLVYDHVLGAQHADREPELTGPYTDADPFHDPLVMLAYLAGITSRLELVTGVLVLPQRQAALVARQCADLDLLSGGRLRLGVGTGWNHVEYTALGTDFGSRGLRFDEQLGVLRQLWDQPLVTFHGAFHEIDRANINPRPRRPIPLWFGGFSETAFKRAARVGDGFIHAGSLERATQAMARVDSHLEAGGRTNVEFGHELPVRAASGPEAAATIAGWAAAGGTHACVLTMGLGLDSIEAHIDRLAEVRSALR